MQELHGELASDFTMGHAGIGLYHDPERILQRMSTILMDRGSTEVAAEDYVTTISGTIQLYVKSLPKL